VLVLLELGSTLMFTPSVTSNLIGVEESVGTSISPNIIKIRTMNRIIIIPMNFFSNLAINHHGMLQDIAPSITGSTALSIIPVYIAQLPQAVLQFPDVVLEVVNLAVPSCEH